MADEQAILSVGALVRGRYAIQGTLDPSSTGMLYLVKDQKNPAPQAPFLVLKEISGLDAQARFLFTVRGAALSQLKHPALPQIHALINDDRRGCIYLVMEYIEGEQLAHMPWGYVNWPELRNWCEPLISVLSYMHRQEEPLFHGDLTPENIVRHSSQKTMLVDPGYIQARTGDTSRSNCYHAPEQFAGQLDERSDVYGCGALLYALLSGEEPVDAQTRQERVNRKKSDPLVALHKLTPHIPQELSEALMQALSLDPAERFTSVRGFWKTLLPLTDELETPLPVAQPAPLPVTPPAPLPAASGPGISGAATGLTPTRPRPQRAPAHPGTQAPITRVYPVQPQQAPSMSTIQRMLFPIIAGALTLLLLLMSAGVWAWGAVHNQNNRPTSVTAQTTLTALASPAGNPQAGSALPTPTPTPIHYPSITGKYKGTFSPVNSNVSTLTFTLIINWQQGKFFAGDFYAPTQDGSVSGSLDPQLDVTWMLFDASGNAVMHFYGGLNGISETQTNTLDNVGGTYYSCAAPRSPQCNKPEGSAGDGGLWSLSYLSSV